MRILVFLLAVLAGATAAQATQRETIVPERWQKTYDTYHFAPVVRAGNTLYFSGVVGKGENPEEQFTSAFEEIERLLEDAGAGWDDVVEISTFHVNLSEHFKTFAKVKDEFIKAPYPAWTAVGVTELLAPGGLVEIKITAVTGPRMIPAK